MMFHGFLAFVLGPPLRGGRFDIPYQLNNWYNLWMRVEGPHNCMVMAFGSCVK